MNTYHNENVATKEAVSVSEMAAMLSLSRSRLYQLMGTAFPYPVYDLLTRRAEYPECLQRICLEVRRRNCGVNGQSILFYARRMGAAMTARPRKATATSRIGEGSQPQSRIGGHADEDRLATVLLGVQGLGLTTPDLPAMVTAAVKAEFPTGMSGTDDLDVIRKVFLHLKRRDSTDKVNG